jgi:hypothetical protein
MRTSATRLTVMPMQHDRRNQVVPIREEVRLGDGDVAGNRFAGKRSGDFRRYSFDDDAPSTVQLRTNHCRVWC